MVELDPSANLVIERVDYSSDFVVALLIRLKAVDMIVVELSLRILPQGK
jgi:hypothetical protein